MENKAQNLLEVNGESKPKNGTVWVSPGEGATVMELLAFYYGDPGLGYLPLDARTNLALTGAPLKAYDMQRIMVAVKAGA